MDVIKLLEQLEELVEHRPVPVLGKMRPFRKAFFLDIDDVLDFTHEIRASLPKQIQSADLITREKESILNEAREKAKSIEKEAAAQAALTLKTAQEDARFQISTHEILRQATQEGMHIVEQARVQAEGIRQGAMDYAQTMLDNMNQTLASLSEHVAQVQQAGIKAREELQG